MIEIGTTTDYPSHVMAINIVRSSWTVLLLYTTACASTRSAYPLPDYQIRHLRENILCSNVYFIL